MPEALPDAQLKDLFKEQVPTLAELYDRFTRPLNPLSDESIEAEKLFKSEVARWRDHFLGTGFGAQYQNDLPTFQKMMIRLCRDYLRTSGKWTTLSR